VLRSFVQRTQILVQISPVARKLAAADRVIAALRVRPVVAAVALTGLALIGPRVLVRWALRLAPIYALFNRG
jgi:hypothetical protein